MLTPRNNQFLTESIGLGLPYLIKLRLVTRYSHAVIIFSLQRVGETGGRAAARRDSLWHGLDERSAVPSCKDPGYVSVIEGRLCIDMAFKRDPDTELSRELSIKLDVRSMRLCIDCGH